MRFRKLSRLIAFKGVVLSLGIWPLPAPCVDIPLAFSTDEDWFHGDLAIRDHDIAGTDLMDGWERPFAAMTDQLPPGANIDALDIKDPMLVFFSLDADTFLGDLPVADEDIILWDGTEFILLWDGSENYLSPDMDIDALFVVSLEPLAFIYSLDADYYDEQYAGLISDEDIQEWANDGQGGIVTVFILDGDTVGIPPSLNLDAFAIRGEDEWLLSFDASGSIGDLVFDDADLVMYHPQSGTFDPVPWFIASDHGVPSEVDLNAAFVAPVIEPTPTSTPAPTPTEPTPTLPPTITPTVSMTPSATPSLTFSPTASPTASPSATLTPTVSATPSLSASPSPSPTSTVAPSPTLSPTPISSGTVTPTPSPTPSSTVSFTTSPSPSVTSTMTATPTASSTAIPSSTASPSPTGIVPTYTATPSPTLSPTLTPSLTRTPAPTPTPTPAPTPTAGPPIDSDGDGYADWYEGHQGTDPYNPAERPLLGDVNGDGIVGYLDGLILFRILGNESPEAYGDLPDVTYDGVCDMNDALTLYRWAIGMPEYRILPRP